MEEGSGLSTGAIVAIIVGVIAVIIVAIAVVAIHRQKEDESQAREVVAGDEAAAADLGVPVPVPVVTAPAEEKEDDDDDSAAPSVWSGDEEEDAIVELHVDQEIPGALTAGSALAAMGAASTVTARISAGDGVV